MEPPQARRRKPNNGKRIRRGGERRSMEEKSGIPGEV
jgi:hypothetical protein